MPISSGVGEFTQTHGFVSGLILVSVGIMGIYGALSGNLAAMLAALFEPTDLYTINASFSGAPPAIPGPGGGPSGGGGGGGTPSSPALPSTPLPPAIPSAPPIQIPLPGGGTGIGLPAIGAV